MAAPTTGQVVDGYRYLGGDPNRATSWGPAVMADSPEDQKTIGDARAQANQALGVAMQAGRFMGVNKDRATGPGMNMALGGFWGLPRLGVDDIAKMRDPAYQQMDSITASQTPSMRPAGSGATSDFEQRLYRQGFPNIQNFGDANQAVAGRLHDQAVHDSARSAYLETWMQHKGTLLGAEPAFEDYWAKNSGKFTKSQAMALPSQSQTPAMPKVGDVQDGHVFTGGNPASPHSWSPVNQ